MIEWIPEKEYLLRQELLEKRHEYITKRLLWGLFVPEDELNREDENIKLAWVYIEDKREMIGVDNKTMKGYRMEEDIPTWKRPLEPQEYDRFERWCTTFDV